MLHTALYGNTVLDYAALSCIILYCTMPQPGDRTDRPGDRVEYVVCTVHMVYIAHIVQIATTQYM